MGRDRLDSGLDGLVKRCWLPNISPRLKSIHRLSIPFDAISKCNDQHCIIYLHPIYKHHAAV